MLYKTIKTLAIFSLFAVSTAATAVPFTDVQEYSNNTATEWFVENHDHQMDDDYWRFKDQDWGWTHNAISGTFSSIVLDISAYDVDFYQRPSSSLIGERDMLSVFTGTSWFDLGLLSGSHDTWDFNTFDLSGYSWAQGQVNAGLQVRVDIDTADEEWRLTLGKAALTVDGGHLECVPTPGVPCTNAPNPVPAPSTLLLLGAGLIGTVYSRKLKKA